VTLQQNGGVKAMKNARRITYFRSKVVRGYMFVKVTGIEPASSHGLLPGSVR
jgi:hypothetical protein